jgi:hypothetical protein
MIFRRLGSPISLKVAASSPQQHAGRGEFDQAVEPEREQCKRPGGDAGGDSYGRLEHQVGGLTVMAVAGAGILLNGGTALLFARGRKGDSISGAPSCTWQPTPPPYPSAW